MVDSLFHRNLWILCPYRCHGEHCLATRGKKTLLFHRIKQNELIVTEKCLSTKNSVWELKMRVQVLVATMNQNDYTLLDEMNIQSEAIIGNQCDRYEVEEFVYHGYDVMYFSTAERGVGLNRNNALMRANADVCLFADDDMKFVDGYVDIVNNAFNENPKADVLIFNLHEKQSVRSINDKQTRVRFFNFMRYGAARIAVRLKSVKENNIYFNQCFGGGTEHSAREDTIFLADCLKKGLKIYTYPKYLAELSGDRESTWFKGFTDKYLIDKGYVFRTISKKWWKILCLQDSIRHCKKYNRSWFSVYKTMTRD